jgi:serine/threonine-protein kinase RsbW
MPNRTQGEVEFDPEKLQARVQVTLAGDQNCVDPVVQAIMELLRQMDCANGHENEIELALHEALANAVVHGCKNDASQIVECIVACDAERGMLIVVRDPGEGFDPKSIPSPVEGENVFSTHGRGIFLINQLMDEVQFHKNGTEIRMIKKGAAEPGRPRTR